MIEAPSATSPQHHREWQQEAHFFASRLPVVAGTGREESVGDGWQFFFPSAQLLEGRTCTLTCQPRHGLLALRASCTASRTTDGGRSGQIVNIQKATSEQQSPVARLVLVLVWSTAVLTPRAGL
ncbi:uncharacterized protein PgNI_06945 [Pyricularia grisea]|uniref:Uncharacterized protein n=1 Tax=Pyricularia grisea TaxID=148305 RepID=A0A6P8B3L4_PYRGI|nr:uncharacterized protein PgNI_06945 [Pyricularia grisea]TLD09288.1 hypothetical protein PgNI_06945 [Pyricularia grisea]